MTTPTKPAKTGMSSRLLTMKFMQRAAASSPVSTPDTTEQPPAKRQKLRDRTSRDESSADLRAMQAAVAAEELKRTQALDRQAAEAGDTKWRMDFARSSNHNDVTGFNVISAGYSSIDAQHSHLQETDQDGEEVSQRGLRHSGRKSFGSFGKTAEKAQRPDPDGSSVSSGDGTDAESDEGGDGTSFDAAGSKRHTSSEAADQLRAKRKARKEAERAGAVQLGDKRRKKEVKLNKLSSISSGGGSKSRGAPSTADVTCFVCGGKGHRKKDCPRGGGNRGKNNSS